MSLLNRTKTGSRALMLVTNRQQCRSGSLVETVAQAVAGGVTAVQLREKDMPAGELLALARQLRGVCGPDALLLINDRVDVALMAGADGVHLGEQSVPVAAARKLLPPSMLVGRSVHSVNAAREAEQDGADYLLVGTLFPSPSHPDVVPAGAELLQNIKARVAIPVLGIGGINVENADACWKAGADGIAVQSAILRAEDARAAAARLAPVPEEA
jgi:thiamine-phosphate pyrophosphorylase